MRDRSVLLADTSPAPSLSRPGRTPGPPPRGGGGEAVKEAASIPELLRTRAERAPDAVALVAPGRPALTFAGLRQQLEDTIGALNGWGVGRGDRVALVLPQGPEMTLAFLAVASCATSAPLNPAYGAAEFDFYLTDLGPRALIMQAGMDCPARAVARARSIPVLELSPGDGGAGRFTLAGGGAAAATHGGLAEGNDVALVLHTSGTTARPKIIPLTHRNFCASARGLGRVLDLSPGDRCLNVMPLFHAHALIFALASLAAGASVACTPAFDPTRFFAWMDELAPTWYTAVPTIHQAVVAQAARHRDIIARRPLRFIRSSAAPLPPQVMADLERTFGAPVVEGYGQSESVAFVTHNPLPPGRRVAGSVGVAAGPELAILDGAGRPLPAGETGEIVVRGENVFGGYANDPEVNARAFVRGWYRTGDLGYLDADGYLFVTGRLKEIINRGGEKISPREVDEALLDHPAVAQAVTFPIPHPTLGEDVAAAVVLRPDAAATEATLGEFLAPRLAPFKRPRHILLLAEIPKGPTGKPERLGLAKTLGLAGGAGAGRRAPAVAPRSEIEAALARLWCEVLGLAAVGVYDNFLDLGGDSLRATQVLGRLQESLGVEVSLADTLDTPTVAALAGVVSRRLAERAASAGAQELLSEVEGLSDAEAARLLASEWSPPDDPRLDR